MAVVPDDPDDYAGPMPDGAVRETDYQRMVGTYGNIESGMSSMQMPAIADLSGPKKLSSIVFG